MIRIALTLLLLAGPAAADIAGEARSLAGLGTAAVVATVRPGGPAGGAPWETLLRSEVFEPLGMTQAGFGAPPAIWGHGDRAMPPGPQADNIPALGPAGTVHLPVGDMLRFLGAHVIRDPAYLPREAWRRLHTPVGQYAMGWRIAEDGSLRHYGTNTFWMARMRVIPGERAIFVAVNRGGEEALAETEAAMSRLAAGPEH